MSDLLKGNFKTKQVVTAKEKAIETLEDRFEREALRRLGGSIAFVSKKKIMWDAKDTGAKATPAAKDAADTAAPPAPLSKAGNGK